MRRALIAGCGALVVWVSQACVFAPTNQADGASCSDDKECRSRRCYEGYCSGSDCEKDKGACASGWKCIHHKPDPISGFFGADGSDTCRATCGSCPGNQYCEKDGKVGETLCSFGKAPLDLVVSAPKAFAGQPVTIIATANGATLTKCTWEIGDGQSEPSTATSITHTFKEAREYGVRASCESDDKRNGFSEGIVTVECQPSGSACAMDFCCADASSVCLPTPTGNLCREPKDPAATISGPTAIAIHQEATYAVAVAGGDGTLESATWTLPGSFATKSGASVTHSFSKAGKTTIKAAVMLSTKRTVQAALDVDVCQSSLGECKLDGSIACCAPLTCKPSGSVYRCGS